MTGTQNLPPAARNLARETLLSALATSGLYPDWEALERARDRGYDASDAHSEGYFGAALPICVEVLRADPAHRDCLSILSEIARTPGPEGDRENLGWQRRILEVATSAYGHRQGLPGASADFDARPLNRARYALAVTLLKFELNAEAEMLLKTLLKKNARDGSGARYLLASIYLAGGRQDETRRLIRTGDTGVVFRWGRVLLTLLSGKGDLNRHLKDAREDCRYAPEVILAADAPSVTEDEYDRPGTLGEAQSWAGELRRSWRPHTQAMTWLQEQQTSTAL